MYSVQPGNGPAGASIPVGWKIIIKNGTSYYVKESNFDHESALMYLRYQSRSGGRLQ